MCVCTFFFVAKACWIIFTHGSVRAALQSRCLTSNITHDMDVLKTYWSLLGEWNTRKTTRAPELCNMQTYVHLDSYMINCIYIYIHCIYIYMYIMYIGMWYKCQLLTNRVLYQHGRYLSLHGTGTHGYTALWRSMGRWWHSDIHVWKASCHNAKAPGVFRRILPEGTHQIATSLGTWLWIKVTRGHHRNNGERCKCLNSVFNFKHLVKGELEPPCIKNWLASV